MHKILNLNKHTKTKTNLNQHSSLRTAHICVRITVHKCYIQQITEQFLSYPPDNHHNSDDVYWTGGSSKTGKTPVMLWQDITSCEWSAETKSHHFQQITTCFAYVTGCGLSPQ